MTLSKLQEDVKSGAQAEARFLMLRNREVCSWLDVWLGMFLCPAAGPGGFFMVHDFAEEAVVALE